MRTVRKPPSGHYQEFASSNSAESCGDSGDGVVAPRWRGVGGPQTLRGPRRATDTPDGHTPPGGHPGDSRSDPRRRTANPPSTPRHRVLEVRRRRGQVELYREIRGVVDNSDSINVPRPVHVSRAPRCGLLDHRHEVRAERTLLAPIPLDPPILLGRTRTIHAWADIGVSPVPVDVQSGRSAGVVPEVGEVVGPLGVAVGRRVAPPQQPRGQAAGLVSRTPGSSASPPASTSSQRGT